MESNGTFLACNSKSVQTSLRFSPFISCESLLFSSSLLPPPLPPQFSRLEATRRFNQRYGGEVTDFSLLLGLDVLLGRVSWLISVCEPSRADPNLLPFMVKLGAGQMLSGVNQAQGKAAEPR